MARNKKQLPLLEKVTITDVAAEGKATDNKSEADGNIYTARDENSIWTMMSQVLEALK